MPTPRPSIAQFLHTQPQTPAPLAAIIEAISSAGIKIRNTTQTLGLTTIIGAEETQNPSGEIQQKLDIIAHNEFVQALATQNICAVTSEEEDELIVLPNKTSNYIVTIDPLDGSPNIDVNAPLGTIFSIYARRTPTEATPQAEDALQAGKHQLAAGYILYGTSTMFVYTTGHGAHGFTYDPEESTFLLSHPDIKIPQEGKTYAINDGSFNTFPEYVRNYIQTCRNKSYTARYMGALVADFHRHLMQGGIYLYPSTTAKPQGKLRLTLECNALALIATQAGGAASNGQKPILNIQPQTIHERSPFYIGSKNMVQELLNEQGNTKKHQ